jgi:carboxyl-terminal processing protease
MVLRHPHSLRSDRFSSSHIQLRGGNALQAPGRFHRAALLAALVICSSLVHTSAKSSTAQTPPPTATAVGLDVDGAATFDAAWQAIRDTFADDERGTADWTRLRDEFRPRAAAARSDAAVREVLREMLARLGRSHFDLLPAAALAGRPGEGANDLEAGGDIGLEITPVDGEPIVTRVIPSGPADRAGVRAGWAVTAIGGVDPREALQSVSERAASPRSGFRLWAATVGLLRGEPGTPTEISFRGVDAASHTLTLTRVPQQGQPVKLGYLPTLSAHLDHRLVTAPGGRQVGYIHFNVWMTPLAESIDRAVDASRATSGIVMDLRQNPGGVLTMLMGVSGHFFDAPRSLGTLRTRGSELRLIANPRLVSPEGARVTAYAGRLAILVDETSYSASEIFAGGMQAAQRARVFGVRTPGGALPALTRQLPNGDVLEYAIGDFVTAAGDRIEGRGVMPDESVARSVASIAAGEDPAFDRAVRWAAGGVE